MYKFLTYLSVFIPLYAALLTMNQYLTAKTTTDLFRTLIFFLISFVLATRLSNIIDKADQKEVDKPKTGW